MPVAVENDFWELGLAFGGIGVDSTLIGFWGRRQTLRLRDGWHGMLDNALSDGFRTSRDAVLRLRRGFAAFGNPAIADKHDTQVPRNETEQRGSLAFDGFVEQVLSRYKRLTRRISCEYTLGNEQSGHTLQTARFVNL